MYARFFIENKETIGLILLIFYVVLLVLAIFDLIFSKKEKNNIAKRKTKIEIEKRIAKRKAIVSQQIKTIMTSEI